MKPTPSLSLVDHLRQAARIWVAAHDASLARLGKSVVNDGGFFTRLETQVQGTTTATLEKFAAFLTDTGNWPDGAVPQEAIDLAHRVGVITREAQDHAA
jgi:hypothetical protein